MFVLKPPIDRPTCLDLVLEGRPAVGQQLAQGLRVLGQLQVQQLLQLDGMVKVHHLKESLGTTCALH